MKIRFKKSKLLSLIHPVLFSRKTFYTGTLNLGRTFGGTFSLKKRKPTDFQRVLKSIGGEGGIRIRAAVFYPFFCLKIHVFTIFLP